jgi:ATP-dependent RNA helicase DeaD
MEQTLFKDLDLSNEIIMAIEDLKFEYATEIQSKAIPVMKTGKDLM